MISGGGGGPQELDAYLTELAVAVLLRALGAVHGAGVHELHRSGALGNQVVLDDRADDAGRALRAQRKAVLGADLPALLQRAVVVRGDDVEDLLAHHVRGLADAPHKEIGVLEERRFNGLVAVEAKGRERELLDALPDPRLLRQKVVGANRIADCHCCVLPPVPSAPCPTGLIGAAEVLSPRGEYPVDCTPSAPFLGATQAVWGRERPGRLRFLRRCARKEDPRSLLNRLPFLGHEKREAFV